MKEEICALTADVIVASLLEGDCCGLVDRPAGSTDCRSHCPAGTKPKRLIVTKAGKVIGAAVKGIAPSSYECAMQSPSNATAAAFADSVRSNIGTRSSYAFDGVGTLSYPLQIQYREDHLDFTTEMEVLYTLRRQNVIKVL